MNYYAVIEREVHGPFTVDQLKAMEGQGQISEETAVKGELDADWVFWRDAAIDGASKPSRATGRITDPFVVAEEQKRARVGYFYQLRSDTHYPILRIAFYLLAMIDVLAAVGLFIFAIVTRTADNPTGYLFIDAAIALAGVAPLFLAIVLIDIADAVISRK